MAELPPRQSLLSSEYFSSISATTICSAFGIVSVLWNRCFQITTFTPRALWLRAACSQVSPVETLQRAPRSSSKQLDGAMLLGKLPLLTAKDIVTRFLSGISFLVQKRH